MVRWWYSGFLTFFPTTPSASSKNAVAFSQSGPLNPTASIWISPVVPMMISMVLFIFILHPHEHEFDGLVWLMSPKNGQPLLPGFNRCFVDPVKLEEFAVSLADLLFDVTLPEISSEAEGSIRLLVHGDVVRAFELNDIAVNKQPDGTLG